MRTIRNISVLLIASFGLSKPLLGEAVTVAALDILSDASAFVADEANVETSEGKPDMMISSQATPSGSAEIQVQPSAQSISINVNKVP
jgi:hypothetical protein